MKEVKEVTVEVVDDLDGLDVELLLPPVEANREVRPAEQECIVKDEELKGLYDEILNQCRQDRAQHDEVLTSFLEMVMNSGDASSASKEAIVNLLNSKSAISDKMTKIADLKTRLKMKEKNTFPTYLNQQTNNKVVIEGGKRDLLKSVSKLVKGQLPKK